MGVSWNGGTPKSSILIGFEITHPASLGYPHLWKSPNIWMILWWPHVVTLLEWRCMKLLSSSDPHRETLSWHSFSHLLTYHLEVCMAYLFWHSFRQILWYSIWHSFWHSIWHLFWRTFWHIFWYSFWHSIWYIFGDSLWLRSGREHCDLALAVEVRREHSDRGLAVRVRRGTLRSRACSWGLAEEEVEEEGGGRTRRRRRASWHNI